MDPILVALRRSNTIEAWCWGGGRSLRRRVHHVLINILPPPPRAGIALLCTAPPPPALSQHQGHAAGCHANSLISRKLTSLNKTSDRETSIKHRPLPQSPQTKYSIRWNPGVISTPCLQTPTTATIPTDQVQH